MTVLTDDTLTHDMMTVHTAAWKNPACQDVTLSHIKYRYTPRLNPWVLQGTEVVNE